MTEVSPPVLNVPRRKPRFRRTLLLTVTLLGCLVSVEIGMRVHARLVGDHTTITLDQLLGWRLLPGSRRTMDGEGGPYHVEINSHGMRDREYALEKPPGSRRIAVVGDSYVFGAGGVEHHELFTELLENQLAHTEVLNFGVPGYSPDQEYLALGASVLRFHPDLVVVCLFWNDDNETFLSFHPKMGRAKPTFLQDGDRLKLFPPAISIFATISEYSEVLSWSRRQITTRFAKKWSIPQRDITNEERAICFHRLFRLLHERCRESGTQLMLVYFPFPWDRQFQPTLMQQVVESFAMDEGVAYIDMTELFRGDFDHPTHFATDGHFTPFGHKLVADELNQYLRDHPRLTSTPDAAAKSTVENR